jgi:hypothetical protein
MACVSSLTVSRIAVCDMCVCVSVCRATWSWSWYRTSIGGLMVRVSANNAGGLGFNPRYEWLLISNNYFQLLKLNVTWSGIEPRTSRIPSEHANHYTICWWNVAAWQGLYAESWVDDGMVLVSHGEPHSWHCVCAELLEVEVTNRYQMVVQWLECSLIMTEYSGSNPGKWTIDFQQLQISKFVKNCPLNRDRTSDFLHSKRVR